MKKYLAAVLAVVLLAALFCSQSVTVLAAAVCYSGKAPGPVTIDGIKDDGYDASMIIEFGSNDAGRAKAWTMWDENNIYVYCDVYDTNVMETPQSLLDSQYGLWNSDSLEIFIDRDFGRYQGYDYDDLQFRVDCDGNVSGMNRAGMSADDLKHEIDNISSAAKRQEYGYSIEVRIPLSVTVPGEEPGSEPVYTYSKTGKDGEKIGFDFELNNADEPGVRSALAVWGGGGNSNASGWNTLQMMDTVPEDLLVPSSTEVKIDEGENVASRKLCTMSCGTAWSNYASCAVDGDPLTYAMGNVNDLWELTIDLQYEVQINRISVLTGKDHYASSYKMVYFDSELGIWRDLYTVESNDGKSTIERTFDEVKTRYIRFIPLSLVGGGQTAEDRYGHTICEIGVFASTAQTIFLDAKKDVSAVMGNDGITQGDLLATESKETVTQRDGANDSPLNIKAPAQPLNTVLYCLIGVFGAALIVFAVLSAVKGRKKHDK